uniref:Heterokaryon incompatibility domain-containing protein n=1 Tax=Cladonia uncialis subsp. uncialis TaxID=180999 RepID=A0A1Z1CE69_CLAUC|nr:hypothetical protein [Cladonia uncialis subsp. uncialis]AUW31326.1 hypothetical protein [Cladonia uncialis subsp. uncialis]
METLVCKACWTEVFNTEAIQKFWAQESYDFSYNTTWAQIVLSGENACNWCGFLTSILPSPNTPQWPSTWTPTTDLLVILDKAYMVENTSPLGLNQCQLDFSSEGFSREWHEEIDLFIDDPDDCAGIVTARPLQSRINSAEAYSQITEWLDQCRNHIGCSEVLSYANLPSRVIEVAPADSRGVPRLRPTTGRKGSYLALSYCWGSKQSYVLTTKNVKSLMREFDMKMLPQTILDAIEVTKNLGFEYLWVDALCILQDSAQVAARQDMDQVLAMMGQIYMNATMTIFAACAPSATNGFLEDRPRSGQSRFDIPCRLSPEQFVAVHIQEHIMYDDRIEPINTRAWTFQEGLLSPRLLIYASQTLQWQCRTLTCNMGGSYHYPSPSAIPRLPSPRMLLLEGLERNPRRDQLRPDIPHPILQRWLRILTSYSERQSSLPSDKLPALSALAANYAAIFGPEYLAGIWARSAVQQLCWRSPESRRTFTRPTGYRAPSWSWAALDGLVYFPSFPQINNASVCVPYHRFRIVEWQIRLKAPNLPYGEVTAGKLVVTTVLRDATLDPACCPAIRFDTARNPDLYDLERAPSSAAPGVIQTAEGNPDTVEDNFTRPVRCLAMYRSDGPESRTICGLMLVEWTGQKGVYRRIGSFSADVSVFEDRPLDTVSIV